MEQIATLRYAMSTLDLPWNLVPVHEHEMPVYLNPRLKRALGRYVWRKGERYIEVAPITRDVPSIYREVIPHEVAHVIVGFNGGHGGLWKAWCRRLGGVPRATIPCDAFPALAMQTRLRRDLRVVAVCQRCRFELFKSRALNSNRIYTHRNCGGRFNSLDNLEGK